MNVVANLKDSWLGTSVALSASELRLPWAKGEEGRGDCTPPCHLTLPGSLQSSQPMDTETPRPRGKINVLPFFIPPLLCTPQPGGQHARCAHREDAEAAILKVL